MVVCPCPGDRILVLKQNWLDLVMSGGKTMEVRSKRLKPGTCFLGSKGSIYASATLGEAIEINDTHQWVSMRHLHRVNTEARPYKRTFGIPICNVACLEAPLSYHHPRGAVGIVKYKLNP